MNRWRHSLQAFIACMAFVLMAGCASGPSPEAMRADVAGFELPKLPEPGRALVYVVRPSGMGGLVRFNVFVDSQDDAAEVGYTRGSQYIHFPLAPGDHTLYSKAENWAEIKVSAKPGEIVYVQQNPAFGFLFARNDLQMLDELQGRFQVKRLTLGTQGSAPPAAPASPRSPIPPTTARP